MIEFKTNYIISNKVILVINNIIAVDDGLMQFYLIFYKNCYQIRYWKEPQPKGLGFRCWNEPFCTDPINGNYFIFMRSCGSQVAQLNDLS